MTSIEEQQEKLEKIVELRRRYSRKRWEHVECDFSMKRKVSIRFYNSDSDFHEQGLPSIRMAIEVQQEKLGKDIIAFNGEENMDEFIEVL